VYLIVEQRYTELTLAPLISIPFRSSDLENPFEHFPSFIAYYLMSFEVYFKLRPFINIQVYFTVLSVIQLKLFSLF